MFRYDVWESEDEILAVAFGDTRYLVLLKIV